MPNLAFAQPQQVVLLSMKYNVGPTMQVLLSKPQAAVDLESNFGQAAMHIAWDADEASPIKGHAIESGSEIDDVDPARRKHSSRTAKARAQAGNAALAEVHSVF